MSELPTFSVYLFAFILAGSLMGSVLSYGLDRLQAYRDARLKAQEIDYRSILGRSYGISEEDRIRPARVTYRVSEVRARLQMIEAA